MMISLDQKYTVARTPVGSLAFLPASCYQLGYYINIIELMARLSWAWKTAQGFFFLSLESSWEVEAIVWKFIYTKIAALNCYSSFTRSGHVVRYKLCWDANNAVGLPKQRNSYQSSPTFLCFESRTVQLVSQHNFFPTDTIWPRIFHRAYRTQNPSTIPSHERLCVAKTVYFWAITYLKTIAKTSITPLVASLRLGA